MLLTGDYMQAHFKNVCEAVLKFRTHKEKEVRKAVFALIPTLAEYSPPLFGKGRTFFLVLFFIVCSKEKKRLPVNLYDSFARVSSCESGACRMFYCVGKSCHGGGNKDQALCEASA